MNPELRPDAVFAHPGPAIEVAAVALMLAQQYGINDPILSPLASERDLNFAVRWMTDQTERRAVVKVSNVGEDQFSLGLQIDALAHLHLVDPSLPIPSVLPTLRGANLGSMTSTQGTHHVRLISWMEGEPLASVERSDELLVNLGKSMGRLSKAFSGFGHQRAHNPGFLWNLDAAQQVAGDVECIDDPTTRALVERAFVRHRNDVVPVLPRLRAGLTHHDANDHNVLVVEGSISGLIDFGDMVHARVVSDLAIAAAYALMGVADIVAGLRCLVAGYHEAFPLTESEADVLVPLIGARLAVSVAVSSARARGADERGEPVDPYLLVSQAPAIALLREIERVRPSFLRAAVRVAAGFTATSGTASVRGFLASCGEAKVSPLPIDLRRSPTMFVSLQPGAPGTEHVGNQRAYEDWLTRELAATGSVAAIGAYAENRNVYTSPQFKTNGNESRSVHLGVDVFVPAETPVHAVLDGVVRTCVDNAAHLDYGPTVIVEHRTNDGVSFWSLYGHLARETLAHSPAGTKVRAGDVIGWIGDHTVNGGWSPHLHLGLICDLLDSEGNYEGAGEPSRMDIWRDVCPDTNWLLDLQPEKFQLPTERASLADRRGVALLPSLSTSYRNPLAMVRGRGLRLIADDGREYLDFVNNVCHVGHAEPRVVDALERQARELNTNTRYLHRTAVELAERLAATLPDPLSVVTFVNSGSEANELALRIARTATGRHDVVCVDWGYHGNTGTLVDISAYKFKRRGGFAQRPWVHVADLADPYRGAHGGGPGSGALYAESVRDRLSDAEAHGGAAAFIAESISGCGGQVVFADGYLRASFEHVRNAGAVCIADEVQVGLGRVGSHWWAFEEQGVVPDIVTIGKPFGNGHPLAAVVTTPALATAFENGMEFFNTFGGNPVSAAVGMAVLDVIETDGLMTRASDTGAYLLAGLSALADRHQSIGDVRGRGLYIGVDLVDDRESKRHATALASQVSNAMREHGVLISTDGPFDNVLKIKPPIVAMRSDADVLLAALDDVLRTR